MKNQKKPSDYAMIPKVIIDYWFPRLTWNESGLLTCICMHVFTVGASKETVSFETLLKFMTIEDKKNFKKHIKSLEEHGCIKVSEEQVSFVEIQE